MNNVLWMLVPPEFAALLIVGAGIALMLGFRAVAVSLVVGALLLAILPPFLESLFDGLPLWILLLVMVVMFAVFARAVLEALIGGRATDHAIGSLAADVIRALFLAPFRLVRAVFRLMLRRP